MLISALLAMVRGFMREVLSIAAWAAAAVAHALLPIRSSCPYAEQYISNDIVALGGRDRRRVPRHAARRVDHHHQDLRHDPRSGSARSTARSASCSGSARGLVIVVVAFLFFAWLVPDRSQPEWVKNAKSRVVLQGTGNWLMSMLPDDPESTILKRLKRAEAGRSGPADPRRPGGRFQPRSRRTGTLRRCAEPKLHERR